KNAMTVLRAGLRSLREYPGLAVLFVAATLAQGALQGAMIWVLRGVLISLPGSGGAAGSVLLLGAVAVFGVWLLRSAAVFAAQMFAGRLAMRVELEWMWRVLRKLLTLSVRFFDKSSRGDLAMTAYGDVKSMWAVI